MLDDGDEAFLPLVPPGFVVQWEVVPAAGTPRGVEETLVLRAAGEATSRPRLLTALGPRAWRLGDESDVLDVRRRLASGCHRVAEAV